jgi:hypothetical protein
MEAEQEAADAIRRLLQKIDTQDLGTYRDGLAGPASFTVTPEVGAIIGEIVQALVKAVLERLAQRQESLEQP